MVVPLGTIYLYTDTYTGQTAQVPDLTGKSADFARQMLQAAGFNCIVEGSASGLVQAQSEAPGSTAQLGTIVTITCGCGRRRRGKREGCAKTAQLYLPRVHRTIYNRNIWQYTERG